MTHDIEDTIARYFQMKVVAPNMYHEAMGQYQTMATGGDGGSMGYIPEGFKHVASYRERYYPDREDSFFRQVLEGLGEFN